MPSSEGDIRSRAEAAGQQHVFRFWDELSESQRAELLADLDRIDLDVVANLVKNRSTMTEQHLDPSKIEAPEIFPPEPKDDQKEFYARARERGIQLLKESKVAAMVVAGGQGTRLGFDGPKGSFQVTPIKQKPLFQVFAEAIRGLCKRYNCRLPWYIMTSNATDEPTRAYFEEHDYFGLDRGEVRFFQQGVMPAVDDQGRILLAERHRVALSPNGHGGSLLALRQSGVLADMQARGIEVVSYYQVDNPLISIGHELFIGLHAETQSQFSSIAVSKADDFEKVGNFARIGDVTHVIEYSDLPEELARARKPDGSRLLDAGNVAIHLIDPRFVRELTGGEGLEMPWHLANKKVPYIDLETGKLAKTNTPNATKFEMFIFDAISLAKRTCILELPRLDCFSPVKNAEGNDSPATSRRDQIRRAALWLEHCGVKVPRDKDGEPAVTLEISPLRAQDGSQLCETLSKPIDLKPGDSLYLGDE